MERSFLVMNLKLIQNEFNFKLEFFEEITGKEMIHKEILNLI